MFRAGWILSFLFALFIVAASVIPKLSGAEAAASTMTGIGWSSQYLLLIGALEFVGTILFIVPRTALLGAILMPAVIGGAIASHL